MTTQLQLINIVIIIFPVTCLFLTYFLLRISVHWEHNIYFKYVLPFLQVSRSLPLEADTSLIHMSWALNLWTVLYLSYEITRPVNNLFLIPPAEICYRLPYTQQILNYFTGQSGAVYLPDLSHYIKHDPASWRPYIIISACTYKEMCRSCQGKRGFKIHFLAKAYIQSQTKISAVNVQCCAPSAKKH